MRALFPVSARFLPLLLLAVVYAVPSWATVWDVTADFSGSSNPNGAWSYGWESVAGYTNPPDWTKFAVYTTPYQPVAGSPGWHTPGVSGDGTPAIWKNVTGLTGYGVPKGWVSIHPGSGSQPSVVRWTSPVSGLVSLTGLFGAGDSAALDAYIQRNGTTIWDRQNFSTNQSFSLDMPVGAGDTIDWLVTGGYAYGNTPIDIKVSGDPTATPELSSASLLLAGMLPMGIAWWRRRRS